MRHDILRKAIAPLIMLANYGGGWAVPASPYITDIQQPDGTVISVMQIGDERSHCYCTADRVPIAKDSQGYFRYIQSPDKKQLSKYIARNSEQRSPEETIFVENLKANGTLKKALQRTAPGNLKKQAPSKLGFPNKGEVRGLIILAEYSDLKFSSEEIADKITAQMNRQGYSENGATGSARDYFIDQSNGLFFPYFDVIGPITLPNNMAYYGENDFSGNDLNIGQMIADACTEADITCGTDFSKYDYDNDGMVDLAYVIYAGYAESNNAPENTIWPSAGSLEEFGISLELDGKTISTFACSSELSGTTGEELSGIGTFCHEFSHCLGLPDIYNTTYGDTFGMGQWSIMDMGSYNNGSKTPAGYSAFERYSCGWLSFEELQEATPDVALQPLNTSNEAYIIRSPYNQNEFFTLENRQQTGWDKYLPGHGLMIVHVDYDKTAWDNNTVNNVAGHERVQIVPADGDFTDAEGDLYPGISNNKYFTDDSQPAATLYTGGKLGKPVIEIREQDNTVFFHYMIDRLNTPGMLSASDFNGNGFTATWEAVDQAESYTLVVAEQYPTNTKLIEETFEKFSNGTLLLPDNTEISQELDNYTGQPGWTGSGIGQSGGSCYLKAKGHIVTPMLDFSGDGTFTIEFDAQSNRSYYDGIKITIGENADFSEPDTIITLDSPSRKKRVAQTFKTSIDKGFIKMESVSNLSISNLIVYSGQQSDKPKTAIPPHSDPAVFENITENHYDVSFSSGSGKYLFRVQAKNQYTSSAFSDKFKTENLSGVPYGIERASERFISANGNVLSVHGIPGDLLTITSLTGQTIISEIMNSNVCKKSLPSGFFLVNVGGTIFKTIIL